MELYILDSNFHKVSPIDQFSSAIWTERYAAPGEFQLVLPASHSLVASLVEGAYVALDGTKEVMMVTTRSIEGDRVTVDGPSLTDILNHRILRTEPEHQQTQSYEIVAHPAVVMYMMSAYALVGGLGIAVGGNVNNIPNLYVEDPEVDGDPLPVVPNWEGPLVFGKVMDMVKAIADGYGIGFKLFLESTTGSSGYSLRFRVYYGKDRTSTQSVNELVRFSQATDTLTNINELRSIAGFKTVAYVFASSLTAPAPFPPGVAYAPGHDSSVVGFQRRVLMEYASDITGDIADYPFGKVDALLAQRAKDLLANNNFTKVVDGEVIPQVGYFYGTDYSLGDIVELEGPSGLLQKARITEYIRSQDETGERAYPTVSVIDD